MQSPIEIQTERDEVVVMLAEQSGLWDITDGRVAILTEYLGRVSAMNRSALEEMLGLAGSGERLWTCKAEYYAAIDEIRRIRLTPTKDEIDDLCALVAESSRRDGVGHREWVKKTLELLERVSDGL